MTDDKKVKKIGMKDIQRENWEYELTVSLNLDRDTHTAIASKDRTELFEGKDPFVITEKTGKIIKKWCETGVEIKEPPPAPKWSYTPDLRHELDTLAESATLDDNARFAAENSIANVKSEADYNKIKVRLTQLQIVPA